MPEQKIRYPEEALCLWDEKIKRFDLKIEQIKNGTRWELKKESLLGLLRKKRNELLEMREDLYSRTEGVRASGGVFAPVFCGEKGEADKKGGGEFSYPPDPKKWTVLYPKERK